MSCFPCNYGYLAPANVGPGHILILSVHSLLPFWPILAKNENGAVGARSLAESEWAARSDACNSAPHIETVTPNSFNGPRRRPVFDLRAD
jgi:hypothetical protein